MANYFINFCVEADMIRHSPVSFIRIDRQARFTDGGYSRPSRHWSRPLRLQSLPRRIPHDPQAFQTPLHPRRVPRYLLCLRFSSDTNDGTHECCALDPSLLSVYPFSSNPISILTTLQACFATIFTLTLRGLGRHTKFGGSALVAAISGGAAIPPMTGAVATRTGSFHTTMAIPTAFCVLAWVYLIYANVFKGASLDGHRETNLNITEETAINAGADKGISERIELAER